MINTHFYTAIETGIKMRAGSGTCYLYLIESTSGHIKIGISDDPIRRFKQLTRTQGPYAYELISVCPYVDSTSAKIAEKDFHNIFAKRRMNGEWFTLTTSDILYLGAEMSLHGELFMKGISLKDYYDMPSSVLTGMIYNEPAL